MKNQFSTLLKEVISFGREEAVRLNCNAIGTGHLLLALIKQDHNMTILLLKKADITLPELQKEIDACILQGEKISDIDVGKARVGLPLSRRSEKAIRVSILEAKHMHSKLVEPEHLLLSILNDADDSAAKIFDRHGLTYRAAEALINSSSFRNSRSPE